MKLQERISELEAIKENLKQAKDEAMQSWLDSRPLIDELEMMQAELSSAKNRVAKANATISELQAQLEAIHAKIKSAKEEEEKLHATISNINQELHKIQEELGRYKTKMDEKRRRRSKLKQVLRLKKQTLLALELTLEAIKLESEAFGTSAAQALRYTNEYSETASIMIQLRQEEYDMLKRRASEQISTAERRISVSEEEKVAAEISRDEAFVRFQKLHPQKGYRGRSMIEKMIGNEGFVAKPTTDVDWKNAFANAKVKSTTWDADSAHSNTNKNILIKRRRSIFVRIKTFFVRKLSKYFK